MRKLLLGMFALAALNVQGQSFGEPQIFGPNCEFIHFFVNEDYFYTTKATDNGKDCTVDVYNDALQQVKTFTIKNGETQLINNPQIGTVSYSLLPIRIRKSGHDIQDKPVITQTFFNNDEKWEYVLGTFVYTMEQDGDYPHEYFKITKAEILDEDGRALGTVPTEALNVESSSGYVPEAYLEVVKMGENYYLFNEKMDYIDNKYNGTFTFYKITKGNGTVGVSFTKAAEFKGYPNPVRQSETFTIEVGEENVGIGSFIEVCDQSGRMVHRQAITSKEVKVSTRRLKGMYIYNVVSGGKTVNTGKVIIH